ncbi:oligoribonuclease [Carica papaya]|uniref:oligoribonuclease n=1 Tax=Carica papaya TaxID=3649 RepID=UPI000B8CF74E|nr:oligoribonuclease [Carica papaya]
MTGLDIEVDRILEIACIITNGSLTKSVEGPDLVIHQTNNCLDKMGEWCQHHHAASGLKKKVLQSTTSEGEAEKQVFNKIRTPFFWVYFIKFLGSNPCFRTRKREDRVQYLFGNNNFWNFVFSDDNFFFMS